MMQVLLVDDSPVMRRYVARTLQMTGIDVVIHEAENGRAAFGKAFEIRPDLIITDLNMPEMCGQELIASIHASPELKGTPVLVISADHYAGRSDELVCAGAVAYMTKPVTPESLKSQLLTIIERQS